MKRVKGFGYDTEKDMDAIEHIDKQPHQGNYILNLVRADMNKKRLDKGSIRDIVRKEIEKYLEDADVEIKTKEKLVSINAQEVMNILDM